MKHDLIGLVLSAGLIVSGGPREAASLTDTIVRVQQSLVRLESTDATQTMTCAGFVVDTARGWVLTARHCVLDLGGEILIDHEVTSTVVKADEQFAVVRYPPMQKPALDIRKGDLKRGEVVVSFGYGYGLYFTFVRHVAGFAGGDVVLDGVIAPGMSGGPIVDDQGRVVAINQGVVADTIGVGCGADEIRAFLKGKTG